MSASVELLHGWYSLHDFRSFDRDQFRSASAEKRNDFIRSLMEFYENSEKRSHLNKGSFAIYEIVGHKADLLFLNLAESLKEIANIEREVASFNMGSVLKKTYSYLGVVELSNYVVSKEKRAEDQEMIERRLKPQIPQRDHVCFYPMSKKREGSDNWYMLSMEERQRMMRAHGQSGRRHSDEITQMISGSIGFDEHEWGVTLFADDPLAFKKAVTQMRFDEVSARFAVFGDFFVGNRIAKDNLIEWFETSRG